MVGGKVIGIVRGKNGTLLHVEDQPYNRPERLSVRCVERRRDDGQPVVVEVGDSVWWQGGWVMWTPKEMHGHGADGGCGKTWDIQLPKVGYSH